jgi:hypothetical protein
MHTVMHSAEHRGTAEWGLNVIRYLHLTWLCKGLPGGSQGRQPQPYSLVGFVFRFRRFIVLKGLNPGVRHDG